MINFFKILLLQFIICFSFIFSNWFSSDMNLRHIPIQESGRIKPLDTYARNQLLLFYGKEYITVQDSIGNDKVEAIDWLINLVKNPSEELNQEIFYISNWSNSPEVEISLGLDGRDSHRYSFYEIINGFRENQELLESLRSKAQSSYSNVEQQIVDIYSKIVLLDELAHSFKCLLPEINIENKDVLNALGLEKPTEVSYSFFIRNIYLFSPLMSELLEIDSVNWNEKQRTLNRIAMELHDIAQYQYAKSLKIIPSYDNANVWLSPWELMNMDDINENQLELIFQLEQIFKKDSLELESYFSILNNSNSIDYSIINREIQNNYFQFFFKSLLFYLFSFIVLGISWLSKPHLFRRFSLGLISIGFVLHTLGIINRMIIMQRPPVSTLYESIIFVGFVLVLISIIYEIIRKDTLGLFVGLIGGIMLHFVGLKYAADGDTLGMLVAVLNSNFWLSIHVTTITFGYGVSLVSGLMGHVYLLRAFWYGPKDKYLKIIYNNVYGLTLIALFFTLFGTILGGIWADQSWGRFWGWDPKENGALLIVMWHLMVLHLRISGWSKPLEFSFFASLVNIIVVLAWFGVNLLSVGLHSYGFTDNVALNLFIFIGFELLFCIGFYLKIKYFNVKIKIIE
jgi:ABC-type transport system involved in cytochrome c biogenesis permease subunit